MHSTTARIITKRVLKWVSPSIALAKSRVSTEMLRGTTKQAFVLAERQLRCYSQFALHDSSITDAAKVYFSDNLTRNVMSDSDLRPDVNLHGMTFTEISTAWDKLADSTGVESVAAQKRVEMDIKNIAESIKHTVSSDHPVIDFAAKYFFNVEGKRLRPMIVLLMGYTCNGTGVVTDKQRKLAEIIEMIHVSSLVHDDVIDEADTRRGVPALNIALGNKMAILAGDFLLARSSLSLARLRNTEVIELISTVIENLAHGEVLQMAGAGFDSFAEYMRKTFYKTASLIAYSCKASALLGESSPQLTEAAFAFGKHFGLAYQLIDDVLDFTGSSATIGKPSEGADMRLGLATAPVLFAREQHPELGELVARKFENEGDVEKALEYVRNSNGIERTRQLAATHCQRAVEALMQLPASPARSALVALVGKTLHRDK